jgi:hypothetical protein
MRVTMIAKRRSFGWRLSWCSNTEELGLGLNDCFCLEGSSYLLCFGGLCAPFTDALLGLLSVLLAYFIDSNYIFLK